MTLTSEITDAPRVSKGRKPPHLAPKTRPQRGDKRYGRSRVTNGQSLFVVGKATSPFARRFADILAEIVSDLGGADQLSEAQRQLARRAASLSLACERIEAVVCDGSSSAAEAAFTEASGGLSPYAILAEAGRILHGIARVRGGADGVRAMAARPPDEGPYCRSSDEGWRFGREGNRRREREDRRPRIARHARRPLRPDVHALGPQASAARGGIAFGLSLAQGGRASRGAEGRKGGFQRPPATKLAPAGLRRRSTPILATRGRAHDP